VVGVAAMIIVAVMGFMWGGVVGMPAAMDGLISCRPHQVSGPGFRVRRRMMFVMVMMVMHLVLRSAPQ